MFQKPPTTESQKKKTKQTIKNAEKLLLAEFIFIIYYA